jgi:hypothetical protein
MKKFNRFANKGFEIKEMDGKEFARLGVINYSDIQKLFINK